MTAVTFSIDDIREKLDKKVEARIAEWEEQTMWRRGKLRLSAPHILAVIEEMGVAPKHTLVSDGRDVESIPIQAIWLQDGWIQGVRLQIVRTDYQPFFNVIPRGGVGERNLESAEAVDTLRAVLKKAKFKVRREEDLPGPLPMTDDELDAVVEEYVREYGPGLERRIAIEKQIRVESVRLARARLIEQERIAKWDVF